MQMRLFGERACWWSDHIVRNTRLGQEQLLRLHPLGRHVSPPPRVHVQASCCKAATKIPGVLTTLWILWHITRALSSLSNTKILTTGLIAMAIFISLIILWWLHFVFNCRLILQLKGLLTFKIEPCGIKPSKVSVKSNFFFLQNKLKKSGASFPIIIKNVWAGQKARSCTTMHVSLFKDPTYHSNKPSSISPSN